MGLAIGIGTVGIEVRGRDRDGRSEEGRGRKGTAGTEGTEGLEGRVIHAVPRFPDSLQKPLLQKIMFLVVKVEHVDRHTRRREQTAFIIVA